jgi:hypothetical protein
MDTRQIDLKAFGFGLSAALAAITILCWIAVIILPTYQATHNWLLLFSAAEVGSLRNLVEGVINAVIASWIIAAIFTVIYNRTAKG